MFFKNIMVGYYNKVRVFYAIKSISLHLPQLQFSLVTIRSQLDQIFHILLTETMFSESAVTSFCTLNK